MCAVGCRKLWGRAEKTAKSEIVQGSGRHRKVPLELPSLLLPLPASQPLAGGKRKHPGCARSSTSLRLLFLPARRLTSRGGACPKAAAVDLLLPGARTANQLSAPAPAGLWTRHGNFLLFGEYTVQCSMSVSAAAQRNSHFVTKLDLHQDARGSQSCCQR